MKKIRGNLALKIVASLIMSICIVVGFISGITVISALKGDYYNPGGEERLKNDILDGICYKYGNMAYEWYESSFYNEEPKGAYSYHEDYFSEENTNYFFVIEPLYEEDKDKYPTLSNYSCDDYQYKKESVGDYLLYDGTDIFEYHIQLDNIDSNNSSIALYGGYDTYSEYYPDEEYVTEAPTEWIEIEENDVASVENTEVYEEEEYDLEHEIEHDIAYEIYPDGTLWINNHEVELGYVETYVDDERDIHIILYYDECEIDYNVNNSGYKKAFNTYLETTLVGYNHYAMVDADYNVDTQAVIVEFEVGDYVWLKHTHYVKSELTAYDDFYSSLLLKYFVPFVDASLSLLIVSCILALVSFIYMCFAAGYKKGGEEIGTNVFHRIPYDVVLAGYFVLGIMTIYACDSIWSSDFFKLVLVYLAISSPFVLMLPGLIYTTVARIRLGNIFSNTAVYKVWRFLWGLVKKSWKKCKAYAQTLRGNMNLYAKWIGAYVVISLIEFFICAGAYDLGFTLAVWCLEKFFIASLLVIAIINMNKLKKGGEIIASGRTDYDIETENMLWEFKKHGENLNQIRDGIQLAVDERMKSEKMKTELITNVSHDIKTPLTSIINYVDLLSKEDLQNEKAVEYLEVLDRQSAKLKKLIQDLIDASKASTGNMQVELTDVDVKVIVEQSLGEFSDKLSSKGLKPIVNFHTEDTVVKADGKHLWRVIDNLINNISKYAQENTRVYIDVDRIDVAVTSYGMNGSENVKNNVIGNNKKVLKVAFKNISGEELNISGDDLMERFVRGDKSRNTEGNGLGLSIAKSLMNIQGGDLNITIDGDLFKVELFLM